MLSMPKVIFGIAVGLILLGSPFSALAETDPAADGLEEQVIAVPLPEGGEIRGLMSRRVGTSPDQVALLFPGYPGVIRLQQDDGKISYDLKGNFLIRARRWLNNDRIMTIVVDCPTERWNACDATYRRSNQYAKDVAVLIAGISKEIGPKTFTIVGTSFGTVSSANLARKLQGSISGAVHTATLSGRTNYVFTTGMVGFDWSEATVPQLFVHHRDDPCDETPYQELKSSIGNLPLITVTGGKGFSGPACQAFTQHGFRMAEGQVMKAISTWITDRVLITDVDVPLN